MDPSWRQALEKEFNKQYFKDLLVFLQKQSDQGKRIFPQYEDIFNWSRIPLENVKVVIIGQDPYHNDGQAHGLCFSVKDGTKIPPSLRNIMKEVQSDTGRMIESDLTCWAKQGVLLLNAVLTVEAHKANSHAGKGWEQFTDAVIQILKSKKNIVYMLWGNYAQKKATGIDVTKNLVIKSVHPSPLSARKGFLGSKQFSQANEYLIEQGMQVIDW